MTIVVIALFCSTVFFALIAALISIKEQKNRRLLLEHEREQKQRLYEITILKAIQDRIGYSLDIEKVIDTITGSLKNLFPYSTASSLVLSENGMIFKTYIEEQVSNTFIGQVKKSMLASLATLLGTPLPKQIEELKSGVAADDNNSKMLASFFHIPLVVRGKVVGLINVSSTMPGLYKEQDMTILYQMTNLASNALTRLKEVIAVEEGKLLSMITSLTDGIFMVDEGNKLTLINDAAKEMLGIAHVANPTMIDILSPLSRQYDFAKKMQEVLTTDKPLHEKEIMLSEKIVEVFLTPVHAPETDETKTYTQNVIGVAVLMHDITLEKSLARVKEDFSNAIVHELRSPLTAIKAAAELMNADTALPENHKKLTVVIEEQTKRMLSDITSLLDAAKLESGKLSLFQEATVVKKVIQDTLDLFTSEAKVKKITFKTNIADDLPEAFIDNLRIAQVLNNIISNSLKNTKANGTITITVTRFANSHLPISLTNPGILVKITDTGSGIPKEKQPALFSRFSQVHSGPSQPLHSGTGLGLYISKGIIESHGGSIFLESEVGVGTTVSLTLPIARPKFAGEAGKSQNIKNLLGYPRASVSVN
ncbi:MAG: ATP-binding protein [Candidatus Levyibacteriota bacterium]